MSFYTSLTGLKNAQTDLNVISHNLANSETSGFKKSRTNFSDIVAVSVLTDPSLTQGIGARVSSINQEFSLGPIEQTGNSLDLAINGQGFFQVLMPDGTTAYTRDGSLQMDHQGQLVTASGYTIQPAITIPANAQSITVGRDGIVSVTLPGATAATQVGTIQTANFINPAGLESRGENLYVETASSGSPSTNSPGTNGAGTLSQGFVETSNVNVVEEMVNMIQAQRAYEINSKAVQASDQMLQRLAQLG